MLLVNLSVTLTGQNYLGISQVVTGFKDTVNVNQSVSYKVYVKNYGPAVFTGYFRLNTWADSINGGNGYHFSRLDTLFNSVTINVGDSVLFHTGDTYDLATYRVKGNGVVIWPKTFKPGWQTRDSVFKQVFVRGQMVTALSEYISPELAVNIYPNPVLNELIIQYNASISYIEEVRICDNIGRCLMILPSDATHVYLSELNQGIYTLEVNSSKGKIHKRFVKQ